MSRPQRPISVASNYDDAFDDTFEHIQDKTDEEIFLCPKSPSPQKALPCRTGSPTISTCSISTYSTIIGHSSGRPDASTSNSYPTTESRKSGNSGPLLPQKVEISIPRTPSKSKGPYREQVSPSTPPQALQIPTTPNTPATPSTTLSPKLDSIIRDAFKRRATLSSPTPKESRSREPEGHRTGSDTEEELEVKEMVQDVRLARPPFPANPLSPSSSKSSDDAFWSTTTNSMSTSMSSIYDGNDTDFASAPPSQSKRRRLDSEPSMPPPQVSNERIVSPRFHRPMPIGGHGDDVFRWPPTSASKSYGGYQNGNVSSQRAAPKIENPPFYPADTSDQCYIASRLRPPTYVPPAVEEFRIETDLLEVRVIAHCHETQKLFDEKHIAWGVQYELGRGVARKRWSWEDVRLKIDQLTGTNAEAAHRVANVMLGKPPNLSNTVLSLGRELDREDRAILENRSRGLGLMSEWDGAQDWYGGQIQQIMLLGKKDDGSYKIYPEPMESRRSYRVARLLGSRRIFQIRIPDALVMNELDAIKEFLKAKFLFCGRLFVPYHAKDGGLYMVEVNEDKYRQPQVWCGDQYRPSFADICNWHNPLALNFEQPLAKMVARNALGFSNSVPVLEFSSENIMYLGDIYSDSWRGGKAEAKDIMTDGAGLINRAALKLICTRMNYTSLPAAVQGRIAGAKGLFCLHPYDRNPQPRIWIRDSQHKIHLQLPLKDRTHRILDLLCVSMPSSPISLSQQSIQNLSYNGVPGELLTSLMKEGLLAEFSPFLEWESPFAMERLFAAISKHGRVQGARLQRLASSASRALGFSRGDWRHEDVDVIMEKDIDNVTSDRSFEDGGAPYSIHEYAMDLIQAGFHPAHNTILRDKIYYILKAAIDAAVDKCRFPLAYSLSGFIIPDPIGVLEEGQIFYCSSEQLRDPETDLLWGQVLTGEIIIGRHPLRLPSDMQKVIAVDVPALREYMDVIVASTKGSHSLASMLAGGDHDGDEPFFTWHPELVKHFKSQEVTPPPPDLMDHFEREVKSVAQFCENVKSQKTNRYFTQAEYVSTLLLSLTDNKVGLYSNFHERAIELHGYGDPRTIRLAYTFNTLLDAGKTGHRLKQSAFLRDQRSFLPSDKQDPNGILYKIRASAEQVRRELQHRLLALKQPSSSDCDKDLRKPYEDFMAHAHAHGTPDDGGESKYYTEIDLIREHVKKAQELWTKNLPNPSKNDATTATSPKGKARRPKAKPDLTSVAVQAYNADIQGIPFVHNIEPLKASYAYCLSPNFAFTVAFRELCVIKAKGSPGGIVALYRRFDELKSIPKSTLRALDKIKDDDDW